MYIYWNKNGVLRHGSRFNVVLLMDMQKAVAFKAGWTAGAEREFARQGIQMVSYYCADRVLLFMEIQTRRE
jgi:hypothetical protein